MTRRPLRTPRRSAFVPRAARGARRRAAVVLAAACASAAAVGAAMAAGQQDAGGDELDRFMEGVLERRAEASAVRWQYVLDEDIRARLIGPGGEPLWTLHREFTWYQREGIFVRSPVRTDGEAVDEALRREYEEDWLRRERRRARRRRPDGVTGATISTRSVRDNVEITIERQWGGEIDDELLDEIAEVAADWGDHRAAIVAAGHRILAARGGVAEVGFEAAVAQARDGFVMLEEGRLRPDEVAALIGGVTEAAAPAADGATDEAFAAYLELFELAAQFGVRFAPPEPAGLAGPRRAALADARAAVLALPVAPPGAEGGTAAAASPDAEEPADGETAEGERAHDVADGAPADGGAEGAPADGGAEGAPADGGDADSASTAGVDGGWQIPGAGEAIPEPRFISDAFYFEFPFEPGNYLLAGRETLNGRDVLRIEYYPDALFTSSVEADADDRQAALDRNLTASMNKTALVTLWIEPDEQQIVRYTFDNMGFDFLPGRWLVRLDDLTTSMTMGQPFEGVWLPQEIEMRGALSLATGSYELAVTQSYRNYRAADSGGRIRRVGPVVR